jgi:branched-chain amino acid transport system ATP-binding protein
MIRARMASEPVLTARGLGAGYGGKPVLAGVDLSVAQGEVVAVIGRNGVGKSTLMRALIGLLPPSAGAIGFAGQEIARWPAHRRARAGLAYVPQGRDVFPRMSVEENLLAAIAGVRARGRGALALAYDRFPVLAERRRQRAGTLSGGQQQQLAIGRALVARPRMILLDEPSEGIQPSIVQEIARSMTALNASEGTTIMLVEQNIDMIRAMAGRCYVMDKGRIIAETSAAALDDRDTVRRYLAI